MRFAGASNVFQPLIFGCFAAIDGALFEMTRDGDYEVQQLFYNGQYKCHGIKVLFLFGMDGTILLFAALPGTWHDSAIFPLFHLESRLAHFPKELFVAADSAFASGKRVKRPLTNAEQEHLPKRLRSEARTAGAALSSLRFVLVYFPMFRCLCLLYVFHCVCMFLSLSIYLFVSFLCLTTSCLSQGILGMGCERCLGLLACVETPGVAE
jgi:hypothetical protein